MSLSSHHVGTGVAFLCLALILGQSGLANAQSLPQQAVPGALYLGGVRVIPGVKVGYQRMSVNFNFPHAPIPWAYWFHRGGLDLSVKDANLWIGGAELTFGIAPAFSLVVEAEASANRPVQLSVTEAPYDFFFTSGGVNPLRRQSGHQFQWWQLDLYAVYGGSLAVMGGFRIDRLTLGIRGANDENVFFPGPEMHGGDLLNKLWIPYLGLQFRSGAFRASVIYTPFAWADMDLKLTESDDKGVPSAESAKFTLKRNGYFLEGCADYSAASAFGVQLGAWGKASYLKIRGNANERWSGYDSSTGGAFFGGYPLAVSDDAQATLTRIAWSLGLSANLGF